MTTLRQSYRGPEGVACIARREGSRGSDLQDRRSKHVVDVAVGPDTAELACRAGLEVVESLAALSDGMADAAISLHALEHVADTTHTVREILRVLRLGSRARVMVPVEDGSSAPFRTWQTNPDLDLVVATRAAEAQVLGSADRSS